MKLIKILAALALMMPLTVSAAEDTDKAPDIHEMPSGVYYPELAHSHIYWTIDHAGFSRTHGRFAKFDGWLRFDNEHPEKSAMEFEINATSVDTNVAELDGVLQSAGWLNAVEHPTIKFTFTKFDMGDNANGKVHGDLTMNGITRSVTLDTKLNDIKAKPKDPKWTRMGFTAMGELNRADWDITTFQGIVGDIVTFEIDIEFLLKIDGASED